MPPRRIAAARIARKGYALPGAQTGATPARGNGPDPLMVDKLADPLEAAEYQLRRAARTLQEAHPGPYAGPAGFGRALRAVSMAALKLAQAASKAVGQG